MRHTVCGVDPGYSGAYAIVGTDGKFRVVDNLPVLQDGKRKLIDAGLLADVLIANEVTWVAIEDVATRPGQGIVSAGGFMKTVGTIYGVARALGCQVSWAAPARWKRHFNLIGKEKDASRSRAIELFPVLQDKLKRKKDVDKAEAALIAAHACMTDVKMIEDLAVSVGAGTSKTRRLVDA